MGVIGEDVVVLGGSHHFLLHLLELGGLDAGELHHLHGYKRLLVECHALALQVVVDVGLPGGLVACLGVDYLKFVVGRESILCVEELQVVDGLEVLEILGRDIEVD